MKFKRSELKSGLVFEQGRMPKDPFTNKPMAWIVEISINEPFFGPDFSRLKLDGIDPMYHEKHKIIHTYRDSAGRIRHRLHDVETSAQIYTDLPVADF